MPDRPNTLPPTPSPEFTALPSLSTTTLETMGRALAARDDARQSDGTIAEAARLVVEDARRHALAAERMVIVVKRAWEVLAHERGLLPQGGRDLLDRLVSRCIRLYFAPDGSSPDGSLPDGSPSDGSADGDGSGLLPGAVDPRVLRRR